MSEQFTNCRTYQLIKLLTNQSIAKLTIKRPADQEMNWINAWQTSYKLLFMNYYYYLLLPISKVTNYYLRSWYSDKNINWPAILLSGWLTH